MINFFIGYGILGLISIVILMHIASKAPEYPNREDMQWVRSMNRH